RELDLAELARTVAGGYRPVADERSLGVELRVHDGPTVYGDPESLERAVSNLLSNAVRLARLPVPIVIMLPAGASRTATRARGSPSKIRNGSSTGSTAAPA